MAEHASHFPDFDPAIITSILGADTRPTRDVAHGDGQAVTVGQTELQVFPSTGVARITLTMPG